MVYRIYVEKKERLAEEARSLLGELTSLLGISALKSLRIVNRYDIERIEPQVLEQAKRSVFSEPAVDELSDSLDLLGGYAFAVEYLPGQFDQRADSAAQCIGLMSRSERPTIRSAKIYVLYGELEMSDIERIKKYVINPVEAREASFDMPDTLEMAYDVPDDVLTLTGFIDADEEGLSVLVKRYGLAMDVDDARFCREYFRKEGRDPTISEIRMIDTYWSDHCRHTTFLTEIDSVSFEDELIEKTYNEYLLCRAELGRDKPISLMDIATIAARVLKAQGRLDKLDESDEINACTVKINVEVDGKSEPWLLLFKNETHNHPTEIEPFGGAATCIGGAIRDPLSGRAYVYGAMRVSGAADPLLPIEKTMAGKLPQRKIVTTAAAGYSSYGNQIGIATGIVDEIYHPGYAAKRMEIGAVIAATPADNVRRETPQSGDVVILLGGATGRDGCGGATGSSKSHTINSLESCGAEVQKGNAPEERKLQRLFRDPVACRMIKKCNDFGAGGVSVAIGELADGIEIDLDLVPKKYNGLDGTELAISESQERMAVVVEKKDVEDFLRLAKRENLSATVVAQINDSGRLTMLWRGKRIVDIDREFLNSNGAAKHTSIHAGAPKPVQERISGGFEENYMRLLSDLNICSKRGLAERFDSTIGAGTVIMPFGGVNQLTPAQAMVQKISLERGHTDDCSLMAYGYDPYLSSASPYHGAYCAVVESVSKLVASGAQFKDVYLTFQEYFERPGKDAKRWGKPLSALLGAFKAQMELGIAAIGGKDSMSGSFESLDVPPTLVSFAVTTSKTQSIISPEFKKEGNSVLLLSPEYDQNGLPVASSLLELYRRINELMQSGSCVACYTPGKGGVAEALFKMCIGNGLGVDIKESVGLEELFLPRYGSFVLELTGSDYPQSIARITRTAQIRRGESTLDLSEMLKPYEEKLESVFPCNVQGDSKTPETLSCERIITSAPAIKTAKPRVLIPVFPGTNCEYDSAKAFEDAGALPDILVINNLTPEDTKRSVERFAAALDEAQMVFIPGGFSGGDEPDGSGKFITAFLRNPEIKEGVSALLDRRDGLMCGICNGFQALIKLGLLPYGRIIDIDENCPTLTYNTIGRHQSKIVRTRICSTISPWLSMMKVGDIVNVPISHGEGRFIANDQTIRMLIENGQIATQYVDPFGNATNDIRYNPNGSMLAVEGITSADGRVFGKMGHSERVGNGLYKNVPGNYDIKMFESAVKYFK